MHGRGQEQASVEAMASLKEQVLSLQHLYQEEMHDHNATRDEVSGVRTQTAKGVQDSIT